MTTAIYKILVKPAGGVTSFRLLMKVMRPMSGAAILLLLLGLSACDNEAGSPDAADNDAHAGHNHAAGEHDHAHDDHDHGSEEDAGVAVPRAVRDNLGIRFAKVERRAVSQTMRVPGQFELLPTAKRDYHAPVTGRIELLATQYEQIEQGQVIARIDSPEWRELQAKLAGAAAAVKTAASDVTVAEVTLDEQKQLVQLLSDRVTRLADAAVRRIELENDLAQAELALPRLVAAVDATKVRLEEAKSFLESHLQLAASKTGIELPELMSKDGDRVRWQTLSNIPIIAQRDGILDTLDVTDGRWVETGDHLITTIDPASLRFMAETLQGDLQKIRPGLPSAVVPQGSLAGDVEPARGELVLGPTAHATDRTVVLYLTPQQVPGWARPGMAGYLEITLNPDATQYLAVPKAAVVRDGVELVFFRRMPNNPDRVERVVADTGENDGRWIEVYNNLNEGDEIVVEGVYQLLAATSTNQEKGGHFHADGSFHEGEDE